MIRYFLTLPLAVIATPVIACDQQATGSIVDTSNLYDVEIVDGGKAVNTIKNGNRWFVKTVKGQKGATFSFIINTDRNQSKLNGVQLAFHSNTMPQNWKAGHSETFKPYHALGKRVDGLAYGQFACSTFRQGGHNVYPGYFAAKVLAEKPASADTLWFLDAAKSSATLTAVEDSFTARNGGLALKGTLNLVLVNALSPRWRDGGKIKGSGAQKKISIKLDGLKLLGR